MREDNKIQRGRLIGCKRIVIKVGTRVLVDRHGRPNQRRIDALVEELSAMRASGLEVVLVSSGAVGAGIEALGLKSRPTHLPDIQMAAAVGQARLMARYSESFARNQCCTGQVLLTHADLADPARHLNARNTMLRLLGHGVVPIVNENDVVSVDEMQVGDNDVLAALVAVLIEADLLLLCTSVNGLQKMVEGERSKRVPYLPTVTEDALALAFGKTDSLSTGGMATKLQAAQVAVDAGIYCVILDGRKNGNLQRAVRGHNLGTLIGDLSSERTMRSRERWLRFFQRPRGTLVIDDGAVQALQVQGSSLLAVGLKEVEGRFSEGCVVNVRDLSGKLVARGISAYSHERLERIRGLRNHAVAELLGDAFYSNVIHRDNMVIYKEKS